MLGDIQHQEATGELQKTVSHPSTTFLQLMQVVHEAAKCINTIFISTNFPPNLSTSKTVLMTAEKYTPANQPEGVDSNAWMHGVNDFRAEWQGNPDAALLWC